MPILASILIGLKLVGLKLFLVGSFLMRRLDILFAIIIFFSLIGSFQAAWISGNPLIVIRDASSKVLLTSWRMMINAQQLLDPTIGGVHPGFVYIDLIGNLIIFFFLVKFWHYVVEHLIMQTGAWGSWAVSLFIIALIEMVVLVAVNTEANLFSIRTLEGWQTVLPLQGFWFLITHWWVLFWPLWSLWGHPFFQEQINATVNISQIVINNTTMAIGPEKPMQTPLEVVFIPAGTT